jgi:hypothetical protein
VALRLCNANSLPEDADRDDWSEPGRLFGFVAPERLCVAHGGSDGPGIGIWALDAQLGWDRRGRLRSKYRGGPPAEHPR